jgi:hypothetical protein
MNECAHEAGAEDRAFAEAVETARVAPERFDHRAHVRLAYVYLTQDVVERADERMRAALVGFLAGHGLDVAKVHATLTRAWILAVAHFMERTPCCTSSAAFLDACPTLLDARAMLTHYSAERLFSDVARARFVEPDGDPIPRGGPGQRDDPGFR